MNWHIFLLPIIPAIPALVGLVVINRQPSYETVWGAMWFFGTLATLLTIVGVCIYGLIHILH